MVRARFTAAVFRRFHNWLSRWTKPDSSQADPHWLGREGERQAARFLQKKGLKLLARNFQPRRGGEVDLVFRVRSQLELVFVEVKTRSSETFGPPQQAVDAEKRRQLQLAAQDWLNQLNRPEVIARFDIVEVLRHPTGWEIRHLENAFLAEQTLHPGSSPGDSPFRPSRPDRPGLWRFR